MLLRAGVPVAEVPGPPRDVSVRVGRTVDEGHGQAVGGRREGGDRRGAGVRRAGIAVVVLAVADHLRRARMDCRVIVVAVDPRRRAVAVGVRRGRRHGHRQRVDADAAVGVGHGQLDPVGAGRGVGVGRALLGARAAVPEVPTPGDDVVVGVGRAVLEGDGEAVGGRRELGDRPRPLVERRRVAVVVLAVERDLVLAGVDRRVAVVAIAVVPPAVAVGVGAHDADPPQETDQTAGRPAVLGLDQEDVPTEVGGGWGVGEAGTGRHLGVVEHPTHGDRITVGVGRGDREGEALPDLDVLPVRGRGDGAEGGRPVGVGDLNGGVVEVLVAGVVADA